MTKTKGSTSASGPPGGGTSGSGKKSAGYVSGKKRGRPTSASGGTTGGSTGGTAVAGSPAATSGTTKRGRSSSSASPSGKRGRAGNWFDRSKTKLGPKDLRSLNYRPSQYTANLLDIDYGAGRVVVAETVDIQIAADRINAVDAMGAVTATVTLAELQMAVDGFKRFCNYLDHTHWKSDRLWRRMYLYDTYQFNVMYHTGGAARARSMPGMPCHICGIIYPYDSIESDHHQPQNGGGVLALGKVIRALCDGVTRAGPGGKKPNFVRQGGAVPRIYPSGRGLAVGGSSADKYRLTLKGRLFLLLMENQGKVNLGYALDATTNSYLMTHCLNSFFNIVPLCGACNRVKNDDKRPNP